MLSTEPPNIFLWTDLIWEFVDGRSGERAERSMEAAQRRLELNLLLRGEGRAKYGICDVIEAGQALCSLLVPVQAQ